MIRTAGTFVDCYRLHGDILDGRGDWTAAQKVYADALAKYDEALKYAPNWKELMDVHEALAKKRS